MQQSKFNELYDRLIREADMVSGTIPTMTPPTSSANPTGPKPTNAIKTQQGQPLPTLQSNPAVKRSAQGATKVLSDTLGAMTGQSDFNAVKQTAAQALNTLAAYDRDLKIHDAISKDIQTSSDPQTLQSRLTKYLQWAQGLSK